MIIIHMARSSAAGTAARDRALDPAIFGAQAERWLDYWYRGSAQRSRLKESIANKSGVLPDPRDPNRDPSENYLSADVRAVRDETTELITVGLARKLAQDLGVLYASDDLERIYRKPDGSIDDITRKAITWNAHPARGGRTAVLHTLDAWLIGLRMVGLNVSWVEDLGHLSYSILPPHWLHLLTNERHPTSQSLAYAIAYAEAASVDDDGEVIPGDVFTAYLRAALPGDPPNAPTREEPYSTQGRLVRFFRPRSVSQYEPPWPLPDPKKEGYRILFDAPNPLVQIGGMAERIWSPIVLAYAERPVEHWRLPIADHYARLNEEIDCGLTEACHVANLQLKGIPVYRGPGEPPDVLGPQSVVHVQDPAGDFRFESPGVDPEKHVTTLRKIAQLAGTLEHLPNDAYSDQAPSIETGPAKQLRRAELIAERSRRTIEADRHEQALYALERLLINAYSGTKLPLDTELTVHWGELATPVNWGARLAEMAQEVSLGITDIESLVMERHSVSRDEAALRIKAAADAVDAKAIDDIKDDIFVLESLVKNKAPQQLLRALLIKIVKALGIDAPSVLSAVETEELRYYTEVQTEISAGQTADEIEDRSDGAAPAESESRGDNKADQ